MGLEAMQNLQNHIKYLLLLLIPFLMAVSLRITNEGGGNSINVQNTRSANLTFDGIDDYVNIGDQSVFDFAFSDMSFSAWINTTYTNAVNHDIFTKRISGTEAGYFFRGNTTKEISLLIEDSENDEFILKGSLINDGNRHHVVGVIDRDNQDNCAIYLDGLIDGNLSKTGTITDVGDISNNRDVVIGGKSGGTNVWDGQLADIRIFNRALSATEVGRIYRGDIITDGLVGHWPLQEGGLSEVAYDVSGEDNHGDLTSFTLSDGWVNVQNKNHYNQNKGYEIYTDDATGLIEIRVPYKVDGSLITPTITDYTKQSDNIGRDYNKSLLNVTN